jgi:hypothetical protein
MTKPSVRWIVLLGIVALVTGLSSYALAFSGSQASPFAPHVSCPGGRLLVASGQAPAASVSAYLVYADGASVSSSVARGRYRFVLPPQVTSGVPSRVRFVDSRSRIRDVPIAAGAFTPCAHQTSRLAKAPASRRRLQPMTTEDRAVALINQAEATAQKSSPVCIDHGSPTRSVTFSAGSPPPATLAVLSVLRRPQTRAEQALNRQAPGLFGGPPAEVVIFRRYTRIVHGPAGMTARVAVGIGRMMLPKAAGYPCHDAAIRILRRLLPGQPAAVQRSALRHELSYKLGPQNFGLQPWLVYTGSGGSGGPFNLEQFRRDGIILQGCSAAECDFNGLVPDGVAAIRLHLSGQAHDTNLFGHASSYYRTHPYTVTTRVFQNTFFTPDLPADPASAAQQQLIWLDARGRPLHTTQFP